MLSLRERKWQTVDFNADKRGRNCPFQYSMIKIAKTLKDRHRQGFLFETYLQAKGIQCPTIAEELATVLRKYTRKSEQKVESCTQKARFVPSDLVCVDTSNKC